MRKLIKIIISLSLFFGIIASIHNTPVHASEEGKKNQEISSENKYYKSLHKTLIKQFRKKLINLDNSFSKEDKKAFYKVINDKKHKKLEEKFIKINEKYMKNPKKDQKKLEKEHVYQEYVNNILKKHNINQNDFDEINYLYYMTKIIATTVIDNLINPYVDEIIKTYADTLDEKDPLKMYIKNVYIADEKIKKKTEVEELFNQYTNLMKKTSPKKKK